MPQRQQPHAGWQHSSGGGPIVAPSPGKVHFLGGPTLCRRGIGNSATLVNGCVCYFGRTMRRPSPALASCAEEGISLGGKVAVRAWPSSRRVSSLAARVHCDSISGVLTLPPSERLCWVWQAVAPALPARLSK
ncbi:hypothetical protein TcCL_Unassigned04192 [Trypanosoma cruzi]|nr:hypothetical protein TcCL_Unassigned04192 [Trypanosoma cruzi]